MIRRFSTSIALGSKFKRLPSLAEINPVDISRYRKDPNAPEQRAAKLEKSAQEAIEQNENAQEGGLIKSLLYGSSSAKLEAAVVEKSFSERLMRGKYVHEIQIHNVRPDMAPEYVELVSEVYPKLNADTATSQKLVGSWRTVIGDLDQYVNIWEYDGFSGYHKAAVHKHQQDYYLEYLKKLRGCLRSREHQVVQEFDFWGGTPAPRNLGGVFELRSYELKPGTLSDWESSWRKGLDARRKVMEPVGAWFTSVGPLNHVYHIWQFTDLEQRKISRRKCWEVPGWAETTHDTVKLVRNMDSRIMVPLPFSPLK